MSLLSKATLIEVYTDGACSGNPGYGGYGIVCVIKDEIIATYSKGYIFTTNNRMELMAVLHAMKLYEGMPIRLWSDSQYVVNGVKYWLKSWVKNEWCKSDGTPIKNKDLWQAIYDQLQLTEVIMNHIKGHYGNRFNELADRLARQALLEPEDIDVVFIETFDIENSEPSQDET